MVCFRNFTSLVGSFLENNDITDVWNSSFSLRFNIFTRMLRFSGLNYSTTAKVQPTTLKAKNKHGTENRSR